MMGKLVIAGCFFEMAVVIEMNCRDRGSGLGFHRWLALIAVGAEERIWVGDCNCRGKLP